MFRYNRVLLCVGLYLDKFDKCVQGHVKKTKDSTLSRKGLNII